MEGFQIINVCFHHTKIKFQFQRYAKYSVKELAWSYHTQSLMFTNDGVVNDVHNERRH